MSYLVIGKCRFKGVARDGEIMETKIKRILELWDNGKSVYTERAISKKVNLDIRTVKDIIFAYELLGLPEEHAGESSYNE